MVKVGLTGLNGKVCAFCKNWNDAGNVHIRPVPGTRLFWEYERNAKEYCMVCRVEREAWRSCKNFVSKI